MASSDKASLAPEVLHFHVKNQVATDKLMITRHQLSLVQHLESNFDILHFFGDSVGPEGVTILSINIIRLLSSSGHGNPKLLVALQIARFALSHK